VLLQFFQFHSLFPSIVRDTLITSWLSRHLLKHGAEPFDLFTIARPVAFTLRLNCALVMLPRGILSPAVSMGVVSSARPLSAERSLHEAMFSLMSVKVAVARCARIQW
jgi:hypothetical protein